MPSPLARALRALAGVLGTISGLVRRQFANFVLIANIVGPTSRTMLDPTESLIRFSKAARSLGEGVHVSTLHRWRSSGVDGIKLEAFKVGGRWFTTERALKEMSAALTSAGNALSRSYVRTATIPPNDENRETAIEAQLDRLGIRVRHPRQTHRKGSE